MGKWDSYQDELSKLIQVGSEMLEKFNDHIRTTDQIPRAGSESERGHARYREDLRELVAKVAVRYQEWYTESYILIKQLLPDRLDEFEGLYSGMAGSPPITIRQWLLEGGAVGMGYPLGSEAWAPSYGAGYAATRLQNQLGILQAVNRRFESSLFDIQQMVQADLFDSELEAAAGLAKNGFARAAGSLAGVVLERHLGQVATSHSIKLRKGDPTISDLNDALKNQGTLDTPTWRQIQRLGDIRNFCSHSKGREPTKEEVDELIDGVGKFTKTLF